MYILIFNKIGCHFGGHLGFLGPHHDSCQSPWIFLHLRYTSNHLCNYFFWTFHAHRHPLRDCIEIFKLFLKSGVVKMNNTHDSSIGPTLAFLTSLPVQDGGPHDTKMAAPTTSGPRWRPPRHQDGGPTKSDTRWRPL